MSEKKIRVRKKRTKAVKYNPIKNKKGNLLPEAEVVTYTGSPRVQAMKKRQDKRRSRRSNLSQKIKSVLKRRESKGKG